MLMLLFQSRFVYYPERRIVATPDEVGLDYERVDFHTEDDLTLSAWWVPAENPKGVLLFCHGNAGNISHRLESLHLFHRLGLATLIFDYRGYARDRS